MGLPTFSYRWEWRFRASPEQLWPFVSDTNRFNRDTWLPAVRRSPASALPNARQLLGFTRFGVQLAWEEEPFEWLRPRRFGVRRWYRSGPVALLQVHVELEPLANGGTRLVYDTLARPRNVLGVPAIPIVIGLYSWVAFGRVFGRYDRLANRDATIMAQTQTPRLARGAEAQLKASRRRLNEQVGYSDSVARLIDVVANADDVAVAHLRPYALADAWGTPRRQALELCLHATRVGLLDLQWDLLCPLCRGVKASYSGLGSLDRSVHCETCNIDFAANFERSVEVTFRPNSKIRQVDVGGYCVGGPQVTPHIVAQQLLADGERRDVTVALEPGRYRIRTLGQPGRQLFVAQVDGLPETTVRADGRGWPGDEVALGLAPTLRLENATEAEQLFILERMRWNDQAATAAEVTTLQVFRDLFSTELLRRGEEISVGSLTILFTDLRDSTSMYRRIGDAPAFGTVLDHFTVFREEIDREEGALVKTIGDAVMGVFRHPGSALRAILSAQRRLAKPANGTPQLFVKAGLHHGPCIAVTLNDRLDYFGSVVNVAARLERFSSGADVIITDAVRDDPEVAELLSTPDGHLTAEPFAAQLKGFDDEEFHLWRVTPSAPGP